MRHMNQQTKSKVLKFGKYAYGCFLAENQYRPHVCIVSSATTNIDLK